MTLFMFVCWCCVGQSCINVTLGFVSPESFRVCLGLADELRLQSRRKEDKLEVGSIGPDPGFGLAQLSSEREN